MIKRFTKDTKATITNKLVSYTDQQSVVKNHLAIAQGGSWFLVSSEGQIKLQPEVMRSRTRGHWKKSGLNPVEGSSTAAVPNVQTTTR